MQPEPYALPAFVADKPMPKAIRRSLVALSIDDAQFAQRAHTSEADAIILDFNCRPGDDWQADLKIRMPKAIHAAAQGGAEVFLRIDARRAAAQLAATLFSGVTGVLLTNVAAAETIGVIARSLDELEAQRGFIRDELEIAVEVDNAAAVWHSLEIARKSARFSFFLLNEHGLCAHLGMQSVPELDFDPLEYIRSQLITVATAAGGMALGMSYPLGLTAQDADEAIVRRAVTRARDSGFKGALCPHDRWVRICNEGFRPSADESAYYLKVIEVFAEGIKRGMASVPLDGKMLDVPVDLRAKLYLNWANRANARDEQKALARSLRRSSHE